MGWGQITRKGVKKNTVKKNGREKAPERSESGIVWCTRPVKGEVRGQLESRGRGERGGARKKRREYAVEPSRLGSPSSSQLRVVFDQLGVQRDAEKITLGRGGKDFGNKKSGRWRRAVTGSGGKALLERGGR